MAIRKQRYHDSKNRSFESLSFSVPKELVETLDRNAASRSMNRSKYLCWLVEIDQKSIDLRHWEAAKLLLEPSRQVPSWTRRHRPNGLQSSERVSRAE